MIRTCHFFLWLLEPVWSLGDPIYLVQEGPESGITAHLAASMHTLVVRWSARFSVDLPRDYRNLLPAKYSTNAGKASETERSH